MKLLLHIGYPKTATTTLQRELFQNLHKENKINFIFRDNENREVFDFVLLGKGKNKLKSNLINVLSDESLVMNSMDIENICNRVQTLSKDVEVIVSIRNHSDLIFSWYVQILPEINKSPTEYVKEFLYKNKHKDFFSSFYFYKQIEKYSKFFKVHILFYEDLVLKDREYYKKWAQLLDIDTLKIEELLSKDLNKKEKTNKGYIRSFDLRLVLSRIVYKSGVFYLYKNYLRDIKLFYKIFSLLYKKSAEIKFKEMEFEKFDNSIKNEIREFFREDTLALAKKYNLDFDKLKKYGYI